MVKQSFFSSSELTVKQTVPTTPRCGLCGLNKKCKAPYMKYTGRGKRKILVVGTAPTRTDDNYVDTNTGQKGKQFKDEAGYYLRDTFEELDIHMERDCWLTNALICRLPNDKMPKKEKRKKEIINACRSNLFRTIKDLQPKIIILLGSVACKSLIPYIWKKNIGGIGRWGSWQIPSQELNTWICPTFHPSYVIDSTKPLIELKFEQDIQRAIKLKGRPWNPVPDWQNEIECIYRPSKAAKAIREMQRQALINKIPIAVDYEGTCLKPEYDGAEITSCSLSIGSWTIAYPWTGAAIEATSNMWRSKAYKIASNLKFEDRWTRYFLGHPIRNWYLDTMVAAHLLDNREGITSVKFQSFVLCGVKSYDEHIEKFRNQQDKHHLNRMKELDMKDMLLYNGMDSKVEWEVAKRQIKLLKKQKIGI
jgi:DNA polymerase